MYIDKIRNKDFLQNPCSCQASLNESPNYFISSYIVKFKGEKYFKIIKFLFPKAVNITYICFPSERGWSRTTDPLLKRQMLYH